jgi:transcriptional regulator with XRE-family HTH domain
VSLLPTDKQQLAAWLRTQRLRAGLSQEQAATQLGTGVRNVKRWEKDTDPGALMFLRMISLYGISLEPSPDGYRPADVASIIESVSDQIAALRSEIAGEDQPPADATGPRSSQADG